MNSIPLKNCTRCNKEYPNTLEFFYKNKQRKDGIDGWCKECRKQASNRWRKNNHEQHLQYSRNYYHNPANRQRITNYHAWRWRNVPVVKIQNRKSQQKRRTKPEVLEQKRITAREYTSRPEVRERQKERAKLPFNVLKRQAYAKSEKGRMIQKTVTARRRTRARGLTSSLTAQDLSRMYEYWGNKCACCGATAGLWHILVPDHWIALASPECPGTIPTNIVPLCHAKRGSNGQGGCNNSKSNKNPIEWVEQTFGRYKSKQILARVQAYFEWVKQQDAT